MVCACGETAGSQPGRAVGLDAQTGSPASSTESCAWQYQSD